MSARPPLTAAQHALVAERLRPAVQAAWQEPLAIVGYDCRFPGGEDPDAFWDLLAGARCATGPVPPDRWDAEALHRPDPQADGGIASRFGAFLPDVRGFDAALFRVAAREARVMDPQHRVLAETAWRALERGAIAPDRLAGSRTGVFVGLASSDYAARIIATGDLAPIDAHFGSGNGPGFAAGRIAHLLDLSGPAVTLDASCASSLVALHQAGTSLRAGECDLALVGGAHLSLAPQEKVYLSRAGAMSPDGRCKPFTDRADGFGAGEGCAVLVLARLSTALREGHAIAGLVRGSALVHDGAGAGLTVPNAAAQERVIRAALDAAGLGPGDMDYVEAHGTGTRLGDPLELRALGAVFGARPTAAPLPVGSVKANIGHAQAAAGLAGVVKVLLALRHGLLPGQPPPHAPTPLVDWPALGLALAAAARPWPARAERPRRAGVSAFGLTGTNTHVVLEEAPALPAAAENNGRAAVFPLSAPDGARLAALAQAAADGLQRQEGSLQAICHSAGVGRARHGLRAAVRAKDKGELLQCLRALAADPPSGSGGAATPGIVFAFGGQGAASPGTGRALYAEDTAFRAAFDRCAAVLDGLLDVPLRTLLLDEERGPALMQETRYAQPALAAFAWALSETWRSWGVAPAAVIGHSLGEYPAAVLAGMLAPEAMLRLVARRGALMQPAAGGGAMAVVAADEAEAAAVLGRHPSVSIAALNGPRQTVLSGPGPALEAAVPDLEAAGLRPRLLPVPGGFHSALLDPALSGLTALAEDAGFAPPRIPFASNLTGAVLPPGPVPPDHWARSARQPVRFEAGLRALLGRGFRAFLEIGPRPVLTQAGAAVVALSGGAWVPSLDGRDERDSMLRAAGDLWREGADIEWAALAEGPPRRVAQPPTPMRRTPFWFAETPAPTGAAPRAEAATMLNAAPATKPGSDAAIAASLRKDLAAALGEAPEALRGDVPFVELGADSIMLADAARTLAARYGGAIPLPRLMGDLGTLDALAAHLAAQATPPAASTPVVPLPAAAAAPTDPPPAAGEQGTGVAALMRRQLDLVDGLLREQLATLRGLGLPSALDAPAAKPPPPSAPDAPAAKPPPPSAPEPAGTTPEPAAPERAEPAGAPEAPRRAAHRAEFVAAYTRRTARSKALAEQRRPRLADVRASAGFRPSIKELLYPITGGRAAGARLWDVDGNEYIDLSMDFGVNLFGHAHAPILDAMRAQLDRGLALGPRSPLAGEVAELFCGLTGMDRVLFTQSGTEAVMTAVRLARQATGRTGVAAFRRSYHGHFDGFLGERAANGATTVPAAPGIAPAHVQDLMLLDYGSDAALAEIEKRAGTLACVLVEPVQSRALGLQPAAFLRALRALTRRHGVLLVFDEMITGLRVHASGAQGLFGVEADLATFGKALGGGVPMAALAARGRLLDGVDGGVWRFGDDSRPTPGSTFFAGTFNNHPLGLAAAHAVLSELRRLGPPFQEGLNERTAAMARTLNTALAAAGAPLSLVHFGSVFRFDHPGNLDLLYYHLVHRGLFTWEGRNCFLSAAHGEPEVAAVVERTLDAADALQRGGFLGGDPVRKSLPRPAPSLGWALTPTQRQIWLGSQRGGDAAARAYVEVLLVALDAEPAEARLRGALAALGARHEALRARIDPAGRVRIEENSALDLRAGDAGPDDPGAWAASVAAEPFDLDAAPPLRVALRRQPGGGTRLCLVAHHALVDGWSLRVLARELAELCAGAEAAQLPPAPTFGAHARRLLAEPPAAAPWRSELEDPPEPLPVRDGPASGRGGRVTLEASGEARAGLLALARRHRATPAAAGLAAFLAYLHRLYDRDDVLVGVPVHARWPGEERMVGQAARLVPVRSRTRPGTTMADLVAEASARFAALAGVPPPELAALLEPALRGDPPALGLTFNLDRHEALPGVTLLPSPPAPGAKFDLSVFLTLGAELLRLDLDHDAGAVPAGAAEAFGRRFLAFLERAADASALDDLDVLDGADRAVIEAANATGREFDPPGMMLPALVAAQAAAAPDRVALRQGEKRVTFGELDAAARRVAAAVRDAGAGRDAVVAVLLPRGTLQATALLGVLYAGAAMLPLSPEDPPERLRRLVADIEPACVVSDGGASRAMLGEVACPVLDAGAAVAAEGPGLLAEAGAGDLAYVLFTSGSTGRPKAVLCEHGGLRNRVLWQQSAVPAAPGDVVLYKTPCSFDVFVWELLWPLAVGASMEICPPGEHRDPAALAERIARAGVTHLHFVPSMLDVFLEHPASAAACAGVRHVLLSGEALSPELRDRFLDSGIPAALHNLYGPTEASIDVTHFACRPGDRGQRVPIGRPVANTAIRILDRRGREAAVGVPGALCIAGIQVARGYASRPELTAERFGTDPGGHGRLYRTGDRARWLPDGTIEYLGRDDDQVKLNGVRIELGEIEACLRAHPGVRATAAAVRRGPGGPRLVAWVQPAAPAAPTFAPAGDGLHAMTVSPGAPPILCRNRGEAEFMAAECFGPSGYRLDRMGLPEDAIVLDAGGNIGVFARAALAVAPGATVLSFEPIEDTFALLACNAREAPGPGRIIAERLALGDKEEDAAGFTYYPAASLLSGRNADPSRDAALCASVLAAGDASVAEYAAARLLPEPRHAPVTTVSSVIRRFGLPRIDLLKVDVEGDEAKVLAGVAPEHWAMVARVLVEADASTAPEAADILRAAGFEVAAEAAEWDAGPDGTRLLRATRPGSADPDAGDSGLVGRLRSHMARALPAAMLPSAYVVLDTMPLTANGKLDRAALPDPSVPVPVPTEAPASDLEAEILAHWRGALGLPGVGLDDDFFEAGGQSLAAARLAAWAIERFRVEIAVGAFLERPTVRGLAALIAAAPAAAAPIRPRAAAARALPVAAQ